MPSLLALDIDGTLCETLADLQGTQTERLAAFERRVVCGPLRPLRLAQAHVGGIGEAPVYFLTARGEHLRAVTRVWLRVHYPDIAESPLLMRRRGDDRPSWQVKRDHLARVRDGRRVVLVDDDEECKAALGRGDVLLVPPDGWKRLTQEMTAQ